MAPAGGWLPSRAPQLPSQPPEHPRLPHVPIICAQSGTIPHAAQHLSSQGAQLCGGASPCRAVLPPPAAAAARKASARPATPRCCTRLLSPRSCGSPPRHTAAAATPRAAPRPPDYHTAAAAPWLRRSGAPRPSRCFGWLAACWRRGAWKCRQRRAAPGALRAPCPAPGQPRAAGGSAMHAAARRWGAAPAVGGRWRRRRLRRLLALTRRLRSLRPHPQPRPHHTRMRAHGLRPPAAAGRQAGSGSCRPRVSHEGLCNYAMRRHCPTLAPLGPPVLPCRSAWRRCSRVSRWGAPGECLGRQGSSGGSGGGATPRRTLRGASLRRRHPSSRPSWLLLSSPLISLPRRPAPQAA